MHWSNLITDYFVAAVAITLAWRFRAAASAHGPAYLRMWGLAYLMVATAALAGGTHHGFEELLGDSARFWSWKLTVYAIGLNSLAMFAAAIQMAVPANRRRPWLLMAIVKFAVFAWWMIDRDAFLWVVIDNGLALLAVVVLHAWQGLRTGDRAHAWVIAAVSVGIAGAVLQQMKIGLHADFDHNDLYHLVQAGALFLLYHGLSKINKHPVI